MSAEAAIPAAAAVRDLGPVDGPLFCFGGTYSNLQATEAVLAEANRRGFPPERVVCTGDVVAYCADPAATVTRVRDAGIRVVMGNCEESLAFAAADCGCGFADGSPCAEWSKAWFAAATAALDDGAKRWMEALPRQLRLTLGGRRLAVIHGADDDISRYVFASTPWLEKAAILDRMDVDGVIAGHAGVPFTQIVGGRLWHNAGVVGMPANDGTPRGWFSILAPAADGVRVTIHQLAYDHVGAAKALAAANPGLPYANTLESGLWPNMDVMPPAERRLRGRPLRPRPVVWSGVPAAAE